MRGNQKERNDLIEEKRARERSLAHLRMQANQAGGNAPKSLLDKISQTEKDLFKIQKSMNPVHSPNLTNDENSSKRKKPWFWVIVVFSITTLLLIVAITLDWVSAVQGVILVIVPPLITWLVNKIFTESKKNNE